MDLSALKTLEEPTSGTTCSPLSTHHSYLVWKGCGKILMQGVYVAIHSGQCLFFICKCLLLCQCRSIADEHSYFNNLCSWFWIKIGFIVLCFKLTYHYLLPVTFTLSVLIIFQLLFSWVVSDFCCNLPSGFRWKSLLTRFRGKKVSSDGKYVNICSTCTEKWKRHTLYFGSFNAWSAYCQYLRHLSTLISSGSVF